MPAKKPAERKRMSRPLFTSAGRAELRRRTEEQLLLVKAPKGTVLESGFGGKRLAIKRTKTAHPNLRAHVKAVKLLYNELRMIWAERERKEEEQLYSARFFNLAAVEPDFAVYEHSDAETMQLYSHKPSSAETKKVEAAYDQLMSDLNRAFDAFSANKDNRVGVGGKFFMAIRDFEAKNVLVEGFANGRAKFILMDVICEKEDPNYRKPE